MLKSTIEKLIEAGSHNLGLALTGIVQLGKAHPRFALAILAFPVISFSVTFPMICLIILTPDPEVCLPEDRHLLERFNGDINSNPLPQRFYSPDSNPSEKANDLSSEIFNEFVPPIQKNDFWSKNNSNNPFIFGRNVTQSDIFESVFSSNSSKNDSKGLDLLSDFASENFLNEFSDFLPLIALDNSLSNNLDSFLLSHSHQESKSVPDPASIITLLTIAGVGLSLKKRK